MATQKQSEQARTVYESLCAALDGNDWHYKRDDEELTVSLTIHGDDLPMDIIARVDAEHMLVSVYSKLGFDVPEDKRVDMAAAVCAANWGMVDGSFDYTLTSGALFYRVAASYRDSLIGGELLDYMVNIVCGTVDNYNDKFFMICKGVLSLKDFIAQERG
ncbi:MAG: hypothetical protein E7639_01495 [Ruminococcaceae bacterium]|nr:hypothetical protein [Oscillospiraceae bacterium]